MTGTGTENDPYIISDVDDLQAIENDLDAYYELGGDIDASATSGWNGGDGFDPIILFTGQLDGKGFTISDLFISRSAESYVGLIGYTNAAVIIRNVKMTGVNITGSTDVGALIGYANPSYSHDIDDCSSAGSVTASAGQVGGLIGYIGNGTVDGCYSSCTVTNGSGGDETGGLIGYSGSAVITSCYATGDVTSSDDDTGGLIGRVIDGDITKCYATGSVSGKTKSGGLVGHVDSDPTISNCYARGSVTTSSNYETGGLIGMNDGGALDDCYSTGAVTGTVYAGGLVGDSGGSSTNCFWDTETSGQASSSEGTGKTTAQMKNQSTFTTAGWDFTTPIWYINSVVNNGYPNLSGIVVGPTEAIMRISSIRHIYKPGSYKMQLGVGDLGFDIDVAEVSVRKATETADEVSKSGSNTKPSYMPPPGMTGYIPPGAVTAPAQPPPLSPVPNSVPVPEQAATAKVTAMQPSARQVTIGPSPKEQIISRIVELETGPMAHTLTPKTKSQSDILTHREVLEAERAAAAKRAASLAAGIKFLSKMSGNTPGL